MPRSQPLSIPPSFLLLSRGVTLMLGFLSASTLRAMGSCVPILLSLVACAQTEGRKPTGRRSAVSLGPLAVDGPAGGSVELGTLVSPTTTCPADALSPGSVDRRRIRFGHGGGCPHHCARKTFWLPDLDQGSGPGPSGSARRARPVRCAFLAEMRSAANASTGSIDACRWANGELAPSRSLLRASGYPSTRTESSPS